MRISLTVTAGPHKGKVFTFVGHDTFLVGRSKRAHFRLPMKDKYFSRIHFMVEVNPPQCRLMDMGSTNGTSVNGQKVGTADLRDGDQIKAGQTVLRVAVEDEAVPAAPAAAVVPATTPVPELTTLPEATQSRASSGAPQIAGCVACEAPLPLERGHPGRLAGGTPALQTAATTLCAACQQLVRNRPQPIAGFQIVQELGRGAMGVVHLAVRTSDGSAVALKTIIPTVSGTKSQVERFLREAKILRELDHPNIVAFREMGQSGEHLYFAMDHVRGTDGYRMLKAHQGRMPVRRAVGLGCQLLMALEYAHAKGFVHRDIKPANLLVTTAPRGGDLVKLADFGLARVYQGSQLSGLTMTGDLGGTMAFMAPEQVTNYREARPPADQYSAAATLYNLLTGQFVYDLPRTIQDQILMILQQEPIPIQTRRADIPDKLAAVIDRALEREPEDRFAHVTAFRKALEGFR